MSSQPYVGEIRIFGGNFAPLGWAFCDGSILAISENDVLFNLIGTTYGGDGQQTFGLPDLKGRIAIHQGQSVGTSNYVIGQKAGSESVTLTTNQLPSHTHTVITNSGNATTSDPTNNFLAGQPALLEYAVPAINPANDTMKSTAILAGPPGGPTPHENRMPILAISYIISLYGVYPSQN